MLFRSSILGPQGDYTTGPTAPEAEPWNFPPVTFVDREAIREWRHWEGDAASLSVTFDSQKKVLDTYYMPEQRWDKSVVETLLFRAKRQWHRWFP